MVEGRQTHSGDAEVVDLVEEHLQTLRNFFFKKKKKRRGGRVGATGSRRGRGEEEGADLLPPPLNLKRKIC
jgi:hypothetical protein